MEITLIINGVKKSIGIHPAERLLPVLRREGYFSVKFGDERGESGASTILLDGKPVNSGVMLAAQADGHAITTVEGLGSFSAMHPLQKAFIETGAIQSGYSTPAQILVAKALLDQNQNPTEDEVREALEKPLSLVYRVEGLRLLLLERQHSQCHNTQAGVLKSANDLPNQPFLHSVRFYDR